jgi:hypothetical protein
VVPFLNGIDHVGLAARPLPARPGGGRHHPDRVDPGRPGVIEHASPFAVVELAAGKAPRRRVEELAARLAETGWT